LRSEVDPSRFFGRPGGCPKINLQVLATNTIVVAFYKRLGDAVEERVSMGKSLIGS
jgi:hypothetical protein